jgi:hypothetical protein
MDACAHHSAQWQSNRSDQNTRRHHTHTGLSGRHARCRMSMVHWHGIVVVSTLQLLCMQAWRCVESQHIASSMKLVDSADEQRVLENLLEASKPRHCRKKLRTNTFCSLPPSGTRPRKTHAFAVQVKRASGTALLTYTPHCVRLPTGGVCLSRTMQPTARQWRRATSSQQTILFLMHRCAALRWTCRQRPGQHGAYSGVQALMLKHMPLPMP